MTTSRGPRSGPTLIVVAVLALSIPLALAVVLQAAGIPILPGGPSRTSEVAAAAAKAPLVVLGDSPATTTLAALLSSSPAPGWLPVSPADWAVGTPYDYACDLGASTGPRAVVSVQRTFTTGPRTATVSLYAYGAGAGASAYAEFARRLEQCPNRESTITIAPSAVNGAAALTGRVRLEGFPTAVSSVAWREGDVILEVHSATLGASALLVLASTIDSTATAALQPVCPALGSAVDEGARSPYVSRDGYTGLVVGRDVSVPPIPEPAAPQGVTRRDSTVALEPPPAISLPTSTPTEPLWPPLPTAPPTPVLPSPVSAQPTAAVAAVPQRDDVGPGCGWAFTQQLAPAFNEEIAQQQASAQIATVTADLLAAQKRWAVDVVAYWTAASAYDRAIGPFRIYAAQVEKARTSWAELQLARDQYATALALWQQLVASRTTFVGAQLAASRDYEAALLLCAQATTSTSTPPASTSSASTSQPTSSPGPTTTPSPTTTPDPTTTPVPLPSPSLTFSNPCPPVRPQILDQPIPTLAPPPLAPPDPRPTATGTPTRGR
ncbi:unannotated protein [freshwater metagenome]|uniref:Unannotated protein n=1 Tax=freshwater metagenome TaxID=449393 RepID=A0A6J7JRA5_9ZZZZ